MLLGCLPHLSTLSSFRGVLHLELYPERGARAIERLVFLLPEARLVAALEALAGQGWRPLVEATWLTQPALACWRDELVLQQPGQASIILRWRLTPTSPALVEPLNPTWLANGDPTLPARLSRCLQVLVASERGTQGDTGRLLAAADLIKASQAMNTEDWASVFALASTCRVAGPLVATLQALATSALVHLPPAMPAELGQAARAERAWASRPALTSRGSARLRGLLRFHWARWQRLAASNGQARTPWTWLRYLQAISGSPSPWALPGRLWRRWRRAPASPQGVLDR